MGHGHSDLPARAEAGPSLCAVSVGESIDVRVGAVGCMADIEPLLAAASAPTPGADFVLVLLLPGEIAPVEAIRAWSWLDDARHTLVLTSRASDRPPWGAVAPTAVSPPHPADPRGRVLIEPDAERAVIGGLQSLHAADAFWIVAVGGGDQEVTDLRAALTRGIMWRAAWDEPENGAFHRSARGPDGAPVAAPDMVRTGVRRVVGVDIFIESALSPTALGRSLEELAAESPLRLKMISNRGTMVYPTTGAITDCVDHWRCRFVLRANDENLADSALLGLLQRVAAQHRWMHLEKLAEFDGATGFTKAQGED